MQLQVAWPRALQDPVPATGLLDHGVPGAPEASSVAVPVLPTLQAVLAEPVLRLLACVAPKFPAGF